MMKSTEWIRRANCRGLKTNMFYPRRYESEKPAKSVCAGCSVRDECVNYALEQHDRFGIWGGLNDKQRSSLRRKRNRQLRLVS